MLKRFFLKACSIFIIICFFSSQSYALISLEDEETIGRRIFLQVKRQGILLQDDFANKYIDSLGHYLIRPLKTKPFPFHFSIINKNIINAFASPGGYIYIYAGLINNTDNVDELAAVICHEIGHVSARHIAHKIEYSRKLGYLSLIALLAGVLVGGVASSIATATSMAGSAQLQINHTREEERQADELGFHYLSESGFNPVAMYDILKKITDMSLYALDKIPPFLLDHPSGPERLSNIQSMLSSYRPIPPTKEVLYFRKEFPIFKTIVYAKSEDPDVAKKYYEDILKDDPESPLANFGMGIVYMRISEYRKAIEYLKKALKKWSDSIPILTKLAISYQDSGQDKKAISIINKILSIDDTNNYALFLLGLSYENLKEYDKAIRIFRKLSYLKPVDDQVYYHLGICYGRSGKLALAHYNLGIYFSRLYMLKEARYHFFEAKKLAKNNPRLMNEIAAHINALKLNNM